MTWSTFYLICFVVGFAFSFLSVWGGGARLHLFPRLHVPHLGHHGVAHAPGNLGHSTGAHSGSVRASSAPHFINFFTLMAFLAWFGGTGYLLTQYSSLWFLIALTIATGAGLVGAA